MVVRLTDSVAALEARIRDADRVIDAWQPDGAAQTDLGAVVGALIDKGGAERELLRFEDAAQTYEQAAVISVDHAAQGGEVGEGHALALALRALVLLSLKRPEEGLAEARRALDLAGNGDTPTLRHARAVALGAEAAASLGLNRPDEALEIADTIIGEFAADPVQGPKGANVVASARVLRALALTAKDEPAEAEAALANLLVDYAADEAPPVRLLLAKARRQRARALLKLGRLTEAAELRRGLLIEHGNSEEPRFREVAIGVGIELGAGLLKDREFEAALTVVEQLRAAWDFDGPLSTPKLERTTALLAARVQLSLGQLDDALVTLESLIARPDLLTAPGGRTSTLTRLVCDAVDQLIAGEQADRARELVNDALAQLMPVTLDPDDLGRLWRRKLSLVRDSHSLQATMAACDEVSAVFGPRRTEPSRRMVLDAHSTKAVALAAAGQWPEALIICDEAITTFQDEPDLTCRANVAILMLLRAEWEFGRRHRRTALRLNRELLDYCGDDPPEIMQRQADLARRRVDTIVSDRADQQRVLIAALLVLTVATAPTVFGVLRAARPARRASR